MKKNIILATIGCLVTVGLHAQWWDHTDPLKLPGSVNGMDSEESMPVFSTDSSTLYFVRTFDESNTGGTNDQDIWQSMRQEDGSYGDLKKVNNLNNKFHNGIVGMSGSGDMLYLLNTYAGKKDTQKGIAASKNKNGSWGKPERLEIPGLDIEGDFYGFHVNQSGNAIIISYNGPNSLGEEDLYISAKSGDTWSTPQHMGANINSSGFEISPFLTASSDTLFFSSNGMGGEGDADIFYSVKQGGWTDWSTPVNLGSRINSEKFDAYFSYTGSSAYWSSNREGERSDIYMIDILTPPPLTISCVGTNVSVYGGDDGSVDLLINGGAGPYSFDWSNGDNSEDIFGLKAGDYSVTVTDAVGQVATTMCSLDEPEKVIEPVVVAKFENYNFKHNFAYNKNKLSTKRGDLKKFLKSIKKDLDAGRTSITINIYSSASTVPTQTFGSNEKLANKRAENMKYDLLDYFKKDYASKVNIVIVSSKVDGPAYEEDAGNTSKYEPYQFVRLETE
ncbi:MAG: SprB repeat-containing protein [bacterium]|nr:SprB repeat-containing protein [bacterium]